MKMLKLAALLTGTLTLAGALCIFSSRPAFSAGENYTFYTGTASSNCAIVTVEAEEAALKRLELRQIRGECTTYAELDVPAFLDEVNGRILFTEKLADSVNYYCSADLPYSIQLYGEQVNLHICVKQEGVTVASPIIFGGY